MSPYLTLRKLLDICGVICDPSLASHKLNISQVIGLSLEPKVGMAPPPIAPQIKRLLFKLGGFQPACLCKLGQSLHVHSEFLLTQGI